MRRALIVGIDDYELYPLKGCVNDAYAMYEVLDTHENGDPNFDCRIYIAPRPTKEDLDYVEDKEPKEIPSRLTIDSVFFKRKIYKLFSNKADLALFYFSGHGVDTPFGGYLMTEGSEEFNEGVSMSDVLVMANESLANEVIIILDCCFSGGMGNHSVGNITTIREGVTILTSSSSYQKSREVKGMGAFTREVWEGLSGEAADVLGRVNVGGLYNYTEKMFDSWQQRPVFKGHLNSMNAIRYCKPKISHKILRKLPEYFKEEEHQLDPSYEFTHKDAKKENVQIFQDLQKCVSAGLVIPVGEDHMYYAAINKKSCKLTRLGHYYYRMAVKNQIYDEQFNSFRTLQTHGRNG